jgi:hypothetical protein
MSRFKIRIVNGVDTLLTTKSHFEWKKDTSDIVSIYNIDYQRFWDIHGRVNYDMKNVNL